MGASTVRVGQALEVIASLDDLDPLRGAVIGASFDDPDRVWAGSALYRTLEMRLLDLDALEAAIPRLAEEEAKRRERVWRHTAAALRNVSEGDLAGAAAELIAAGEAEEGEGRLAAADRLYARALDLGRKPRDRRMEGLALLRLGRTARTRSDLPGALRRYEGGFEIAEAAGDRGSMIVACQGLGNCRVDQGRWAEAERWYRRGLTLTGDAPSRERWQIESNLSIVARRAGRLEESARWIDDAQRTADALGDAEAGLYLDNAMGLLHAAEERLDAAEKVYRSALRSATSPAARATVLINLAECLLLQRRVGEAAEIAREVERIAITHHLHPFLLHAYLALADGARYNGDAEALVFYEQALDLAVAGGIPIDVAQVQRAYARLERDQDSREAAAARFREAADIYDRCGSHFEAEETRRELAEMESSEDG